jgi:hypothetical protein
MKKKTVKESPLTFFRKSHEARQKPFIASMKKFALGGPPEGGDETSPATQKGGASADKIAKEAEAARLSKYANMSRKDFRNEKKGAKRVRKIEDIKSGARAERAGNAVEAIGNVANAASTIVNAASTAKDIFKKQKMGGSIKRKNK